MQDSQWAWKPAFLTSIPQTKSPPSATDLFPNHRSPVLTGPFPQDLRLPCIQVTTSTVPSSNFLRFSSGIRGFLQGKTRDNLWEIIEDYLWEKRRNVEWNY